MGEHTAMQGELCREYGSGDSGDFKKTQGKQNILWIKCAPFSLTCVYIVLGLLNYVKQWIHVQIQTRPSLFIVFFSENTNIHQN